MHHVHVYFRTYLFPLTQSTSARMMQCKWEGRMHLRHFLLLLLLLRFQLLACCRYYLGFVSQPDERNEMKRRNEADLLVSSCLGCITSFKLFLVLLLTPIPIPNRQLSLFLSFILSLSPRSQLQRTNRSKNPPEREREGRGGLPSKVLVSLD